MPRSSSFNLGPLCQKLESGITVAIREGQGSDSGFRFVNSSEILAVQWDYGAANCFLELEEARAVKSFSNLKASLRGQHGWLNAARGLFVNFNRVKEIEPIDSNDYRIIFESGLRLVLKMTSAYADKVRDHYGMKTLQHVTPFSRPYYWMMKMDIRDFNKNIIYMTEEELRENFSTDSGDDVVASDLITNFLWQQAEYIRHGAESPVEGGNVRSLWYLVKPTLSRIGIYKDHYKTVSEKLGLMVSHDIVKYKEYGLDEDGKWNIGLYNPHIILMAEKNAHFNRFLKPMQDLTGVSVISVGGWPATITSEFFTDEFKKAVPHYHEKDQVVMITLADYDPNGYLLSDVFFEDLRTFGIKNPKMIPLSIPENYTPQELEFQHYILVPPGEKPDSKLKKWFRKTNGINGNYWGMEVDVLLMDKERTKKLFLEAAEPYFKIQPPVKKRVWESLEKKRGRGISKRLG